MAQSQNTAKRCLTFDGFLRKVGFEVQPNVKPGQAPFSPMHVVSVVVSMPDSVDVSYGFCLQKRFRLTVREEQLRDGVHAVFELKREKHIV